MPHFSEKGSSWSPIFLYGTSEDKLTNLPERLRKRVSGCCYQLKDIIYDEIKSGELTSSLVEFPPNKSNPIKENAVFLETKNKQLYVLHTYGWEGLFYVEHGTQTWYEYAILEKLRTFDKNVSNLTFRTYSWIEPTLFPLDLVEGSLSVFYESTECLRRDFEGTETGGLLLVEGHIDDLFQKIVNIMSSEASTRQF